MNNQECWFVPGGHQPGTVLEGVAVFLWEAAAPVSPPASGVRGDSVAQLSADELAQERKI